MTEMLYLIITVLLTLSVSAMCSMLEAMILGTTPVEIETLKTKSRRKGELLEMMVRNIDGGAGGHLFQPVYRDLCAGSPDQPAGPSADGTAQQGVTARLIAPLFKMAQMPVERKHGDEIKPEVEKPEERMH